MPGFRFLRVFNDAKLSSYAGSRTRIGWNTTPHFQDDTLSHRLVRELANERALPIKEVTEAFEFFAVARKYVRTPVVVDLCSGHGLAGLLFGVFQRETEQVLLCDRRRPLHHDHVLRAVQRAAPWIADKARFLEAPLKQVRAELPPGSGVVGVHACGRLTDQCLEIAAELGGPVAVLPCCRAQALNPAPRALRNALGEDVAYDVHRTYRLEELGYKVHWREIPAEITPMNRVLIGVPRKPEALATPAAPG